MKNNYLAHYGVKGMEWHRHQQGKWQNHAVYAIGDWRHTDGTKGDKKSGKELYDEYSKDLPSLKWHGDRYDRRYSKDWNRAADVGLAALQDMGRVTAKEIQNDGRDLSRDWFLREEQTIGMGDVAYLMTNKGASAKDIKKMIKYASDPSNSDAHYNDRLMFSLAEGDHDLSKFADAVEKRLKSEKNTYGGLPDKSLDDKFDDYLGEVRDRLNVIHPAGDLSIKLQSMLIKEPDKEPVENFKDLKMLDGTKAIAKVRAEINNPKGAIDNGRHFNCQNCAVAFEMTERGYDVHARAKKNKSNVGDIDDFFINGKLINTLNNKDPYNLLSKWNAYIAAKGANKVKLLKEYKDAYKDTVKLSIDNMYKEALKGGDGSRGIIVEEFYLTKNPTNRSNSFHAFNYKVEDGKVKLFDVQSHSPNAHSGKIEMEAEWIDPRDLYIMRTDNLKLSPSVVNAVHSN